jgi:DNA-binding transcriptional LysR family regulator
MSKTLTELEELAGTRLVERAVAGRRGVQGLTAAGEQLLAQALRVLEAVEASAQALSPLAGERLERLRIGALPSVAPSLLPRALARLRTQREGLQIVVRSAANAVLLDDLRAGELDVVVGRMSDPLLMGGLSFELLHTEPLVFVARPGHPLLRRGASAQAALGYPLVVYGEGTVPRHHTESLLSSLGLALPADALQTLDVSVAAALVACSDAIWITPLGAARNDLASGQLARLRIEAPGTEEPVGLLLRSDAPASLARNALVALLRDEARRLAPVRGSRRRPRST